MLIFLLTIMLIGVIVAFTKIQIKEWNKETEKYMLELQKEYREKTLNAIIKNDENTENKKGESDSFEIIMPDRVNINKKTRISTQNEDCKKYSVETEYGKARLNKNEKYSNQNKQYSNQNREYLNQDYNSLEQEYEDNNFVDEDYDNPIREKYTIKEIFLRMFGSKYDRL